MQRVKSHSTLQSLAFKLFKLSGIDLQENLHSLSEKIANQRGTPIQPCSDFNQWLASLNQQIDALLNSATLVSTATLETPTAASNPLAEAPSPSAKRLMKMHDSLWLAQHQDGALPANGVKRLRQDLVELLKEQSVEVIEDAGAFDPLRHTIMDTISAERSEQADQIQQTVRPGYRWHAQTLRPQEIILFHYQAKE